MKFENEELFGVLMLSCNEKYAFNPNEGFTPSQMPSEHD